VSYFNFEFNSKMATSLVHTLNRPYKGAHKFSATAPDAQGTLVIWARDPQECREHLLNALFDLIFARNRVGAAVFNPSMHLLWRKNTKPRPKQLRYTSLALHESDLSAKLCHRSELPGRNQSPDAVEEAGRFIGWCSSMA
jgi:hypothetical protein